MTMMTNGCSDDSGYCGDDNDDCGGDNGDCDHCSGDDGDSDSDGGSSVGGDVDEYDDADYDERFVCFELWKLFLLFNLVFICVLFVTFYKVNYIHKRKTKAYPLYT